MVNVSHGLYAFSFICTDDALGDVESFSFRSKLLALPVDIFLEIETTSFRINSSALRNKLSCPGSRRPRHNIR